MVRDVPTWWKQTNNIIYKLQDDYYKSMLNPSEELGN